jgi:hypothetical protein
MRRVAVAKQAPRRVDSVDAGHADVQNPKRDRVHQRDQNHRRREDRDPA